jgi:hypothetical protein
VHCTFFLAAISSDYYDLLGFSRLHIFACAGLDDKRLVKEMGSDLPSYHLRVCTCPKLSLAWSECLRVLLEFVSMEKMKMMYLS